MVSCGNLRSAEPRTNMRSNTSVANLEGELSIYTKIQDPFGFLIVLQGHYSIAHNFFPVVVYFFGQDLISYCSMQFVCHVEQWQYQAESQI